MKAAIYCRLSEEDRNKKQKTDDSESIQNQKNLLLKYAMEQGWDIYDIYSDDDYTGADRKRPEFTRLLQDAEAKKFDIILCKTQSRFTRELELVEKYIHGIFPALGIRFVSIVDNADTANKGNKKSRQINGLINEWYLEDMSDNIKSVLNNKRENGFHIGSFALYGYKKDPDQKGHLIIDEEAAAVVREVFVLFSQGYGKTAIARILNQRGIPNPTEYKRLQGLRYQRPKSKNSTLWKYSAISSMLTNEMYLGHMIQGKYESISYKSKENHPRPKEEWFVVKNTHEAIIDLPLWTMVQTMIAQKNKPHATGNIGIFAGKVRCMECGYVLRSSKNRGKYYLQCSTRHVSESACKGAFIGVETLEKIVLKEIHRFSQEFLNKDKMLTDIEFANNLQAQRDQLIKSRSTYQKKVDEYIQGMRNLYIDKMKGLLSDADFADLSQNFSSEKTRLQALILNIDKEISAVDERIAAGDNRKELIEQYINVDHLTREMVITFIDHIRVGKRIKGSKDIPVEIHWNF